MFNNIGNKIKRAAKVFFWLGFVIGIAGGAAGVVMGILSYNTGAYAMAILTVLGGILFAGLMYILSWVAVMPLYGFGELVDNSSYFRKMLEDESKAEEQLKQQSIQPKREKKSEADPPRPELPHDRETDNK